MASVEGRKLVALSLAVAALASLLFVATPADAASSLFRMKRTWWGGTPFSTAGGGPGVPDPYISTDYHPRMGGSNKAPPAAAYVGSTSPVPRFTAPSRFIKDYTRYSACVPGTCFPGYPESKAWYSYWNLKGSFRPDNSRYGGASGPTTVIFATTMGNPTPPLNQGNPVTPTTTPCVGGGLTDGAGGWTCGYLAHDLGDRKAGDPIRFVGGNYDFSRAGSIMITPGANRFGGTMHFFYGANHSYYQKITANYPYISKAYGPQMDVRVPGVDTVLGDVQYGGAFDIYRMTTQGYTREISSGGGFYHSRAPYFYTLAPFTTGMVTAWEPFGVTNTKFTLSGYDNRTPFGTRGVISMVRPRLVHAYRVPHDPGDPIRMTWASASAWQMDFHFVELPDYDHDGVWDGGDNCSNAANPGQDDTDGDGCGNLCDADYDNSGTVGFGDFGFFTSCFGTTNPVCQHVEPIGGGRSSGFQDFGFFTGAFGTSPGPSGTTAETAACP